MIVRQVPKRKADSPPALPSLLAHPQVLNRLHPVSVEKYHELIAAGALTTADRVELIEGYLIDMAPIGPPHSCSVGKANRLFARVLPDGWHVRQQQPVTFLRSEPEPDLCLVRGEVEDYSARHPVAKDVGLLIEVAESTLAYDRDVKSRVYADARVRQYWIVNLIDRQLEVFQQPRATRGQPAIYRKRETLGEEERFKLELDGKQLGVFRVSHLLP